jgi:serine/threonine protein kinase/Tfp pilus assembly protein PilF
MTDRLIQSIAAPTADLDLLVDQLTDRLRAGEAVDFDAVLRGHPEHAADLREILPALALMVGLSWSAEPGAIERDMGELGDFRLLREVGRGGMGIVYEAEQLSLGRRVALKVLPFAATMDPKQLQRFKNEAKAAASLKHDHIVSVYAVGCERGVHYYAMEFIEGASLAQLIARRSLDPAIGQPRPSDGGTADYAPRNIAAPSPMRDTAPVAALSTKLTGRDRAHHRRVAELIADAADALEHAHSFGIVHRDVKPGNLIVDETGRVYVADFGLARFGPDAGLTMSSDLIGTLRYMAPEQALARHGLADHRVDVYGLGATLYELLTGKPAVRGEDKADILRSISFEEPAAPRRLDKAIPAELETIALKCLAKNPNERYTTAGELAADLRRFVEDKPIKARPPGPRERAIRWVRRHRALAASTIVTMTTAALMAAGGAGYVARDQAARLMVTEQKAKAALTAARDAITAGDLAAAGRKISEARGQLSGEGEALPDLSADIDGVQAEIETRLNDTARFERFIKLANDAQDRMGFERRFGGESVARDVLAIYGVLDRDDWLDGLQSSTLTAAQKRQVRDAAYFTLVTLAESCVSANEGINLPSRSLDLLRRAETCHDPTRALYFVRAMCYRRQGNAVAADADDKRFADAPAQTAWDHCLPGRIFQSKAAPEIGWPRRRFTGQASADLDTAVSEYRAALAMQPNHYSALFFLAQSLEWQQSYAEAAGLFTACLAVGPVQGRADVYAHRAWCFRQTGQVAAADTDYAAALAQDANSPLRQFTLEAALYEQGRFEDALTIHRRILDLRPNDYAMHYVLASILEQLNRPGEQESALRRAIELNPNFAEAHCNLGNVLQEQGRFIDAVAVLKRGHELGSRNSGWRYPSAEWVRTAELLAEWDANLPQVPSGPAQPAEAAWSSEMGWHCLHRRRLFVAAVRFYQRAFSALPPDAEGAYYNPACAAALAAAGQGKDAGNLSDEDRARLRRQALDWLRAALADWGRQLDRDPAKARPFVAKAMQRLLGDKDFVGVRNPEALAQLPESERGEWQTLWEDVAAMLKRADAPRTPADAPRDR